jgi:hypothetical protein
MSWNFIFPLAIAMGVTYILKKSSDEIAYLAVTILLVSLVVSLMIAPWQIQIALLAGVLLSNTRLLQLIQSLLKIGSNQNLELEKLTQESTPLQPAAKTSLIPQISRLFPQQAVKVPEDASPIPPVETNEQLTYRGVHYAPKVPVVETQETELVVKYRGQFCQISNSKDITEDPPNFELKYRGTTIKNSQSLIPVVEDNQKIK